MASTKKSEKRTYAPLKNNPEGVNLAHNIKEIERLKSAYDSLHREFYHLKETWEASHLTLEHLISHMSEGMIFIKCDGIISLFNPAAAALLRCSIETILQRSYAECFSDTLFGFSMCQELGELSKRRRIFLTLCTEEEVEVSTTPVPEKGLLLLLYNRCEQRQMQRSLCQSERLQELGEMAATLAHEIRNPLGGIEGFAHLLKRDLETPSHQKMISAILEGTHILNALITQVLDYAKPLCLHFAPLEIVSLIRNICEQAEVDYKPTRYHFRTAHAHYILSVDKERLTLALLNLLRNASEAGASLVDIELDLSGTITIQDDGSGISSKNLSKIFTPFFTTKARGTGLGLSATLATIKAHGGVLDVSSQEGKGTRFTLIL